MPFRKSRNRSTRRQRYISGTQIRKGIIFLFSYSPYKKCAMAWRGIEKGDKRKIPREKCLAGYKKEKQVKDAQRRNV